MLSLQTKTISDLRLLAKEMGLKGISVLKKAELVALLEKEIAQNEPEKDAKQKPAPTVEEASDKADGKKEVVNEQKSEGEEEKREFSADVSDCEGVLEVLAEGFGFLRCENYLPGNDDIYVSNTHIRKFGLKTGDLINGKTKLAREGERYKALIFIDKVNGDGIGTCLHRTPFEKLTPIYPRERLHLETAGVPADLTTRTLDLIAPIGKGQRGMIVAPPKAGKTTFLKKLANSIVKNNDNIKLIVLLIDERPEEVTDMKRSIDGEVIYSTFDEQPEHHARVMEMVMERAQRLCEHKRDVVIIMDSITRLARAYNLIIPSSGRTLSGGLDPVALYKPKKFFGSARNIEEGGSITIIASALVETGSRMDDVIYEEFKGTGNMEVHLSRDLAEKRVFPAIDILKSSTRRDELLFAKEEMEASYNIRRYISHGAPVETTEKLLAMLSKTESNADFVKRFTMWMQTKERNINKNS